jgi:hypothetical protein
MMVSRPINSAAGSYQYFPHHFRRTHSGAGLSIGLTSDIKTINPMKQPRLGDYLEWQGKLYKVIGLTYDPCVLLEPVLDTKCPHCDGLLMGIDQVTLVINSPLFQEEAKPIQTINT